MGAERGNDQSMFREVIAVPILTTQQKNGTPGSDSFSSSYLKPVGKSTNQAGAKKNQNAFNEPLAFTSQKDISI